MDWRDQSVCEWAAHRQQRISVLRLALLQQSWRQCIAP